MRFFHWALFVSSLCCPSLGNTYTRANLTTGDNKPESKDSKIAVIGGGFSGVYTAYRLKNLGYTNITVFEKSHAVGGKTQTLHDVVGYF